MEAPALSLFFGRKLNVLNPRFLAGVVLAHEGFTFDARIAPPFVAYAVEVIKRVVVAQIARIARPTTTATMPVVAFSITVVVVLAMLTDIQVAIVIIRIISIIIANNDDGDNADNDDCDLYVCEHCENDYHRDAEGDDRHCGRCCGARNTCDLCDDYTFDNLNSVGDEWWCDSCIESKTLMCEYDSCEETWIENVEFTPEEQAERGRLHVSRLCRAHAEGLQRCMHCSATFDACASQCNTCGFAVRCEHK